LKFATSWMNLKHVRSKKLVTTGHMTVWPDIYEVSLVDKFIPTESSLVSVSSCENGDARIWLLMHIVFENIVQVEHKDSCTTPKIQWIKNLEIYQFLFHKCFHKNKNQKKNDTMLTTQNTSITTFYFATLQEACPSRIC
jgi:hypothetical protein